MNKKLNDIKMIAKEIGIKATIRKKKNYPTVAFKASDTKLKELKDELDFGYKNKYKITKDGTEYNVVLLENSVSSFKEYLNSLDEETTSGDIATVDNKLDLVKRRKKHEKKYIIDDELKKPSK